MFFTSASNAWHNSELDCLEYKYTQRVDERTIPIIGGFTSSIKIGLNYACRLPRAGLAFVIGCEKREPTPLPEITAAFKGKSLEEDYTKAYQLDCEATAANACAREGVISISPTAYKTNASIAAHAEAQAKKVRFAEESSSTSSGLMDGLAMATGALAMHNLPAGAPPTVPNLIAGMKKALG